MNIYTDLWIHPLFTVHDFSNVLEWTMSERSNPYIKTFSTLSAVRLVF